MPKKLFVPESLVENLRAFTAAENLDLEIESGSGGEVEVRETTGKRQCEEKVLFVGGWIDCPLAMSMAGRLDIPLGKMGDFLNQLKIKVKDCQLGCF